MKKILAIAYITLLSLTTFAQNYNQNVNFTRTTLLSGKTMVQDTSLYIKSGNDTIRITNYGDTSRFTTTAAAWKFTPPLPNIYTASGTVPENRTVSIDSGFYLQFEDEYSFNFLKLQQTPYDTNFLYSSFGSRIADGNFNGFRFSSDTIGLYYTLMGQLDSATKKGGFIEIENIGGDNAIECVTNNGSGGFESMLKQTPEQLTFSEYGGGKLFLDLDQETNTFRIGDLTNSNNGTSIQIDDALSLITITNVPSYADDAAASGAGLTSGQLYKTTTAGSTFLKIVP